MKGEPDHQNESETNSDILSLGLCEHWEKGLLRWRFGLGWLWLGEGGTSPCRLNLNLKNRPMSHVTKEFPLPVV